MAKQVVCIRNAFLGGKYFSAGKSYSTDVIPPKAVKDRNPSFDWGSEPQWKTKPSKKNTEEDK